MTYSTSLYSRLYILESILLYICNSIKFHCAHTTTTLLQTKRPSVEFLKFMLIILSEAMVEHTCEMTENEVLPHITEYDTNNKEFSQTSCSESDTENCHTVNEEILFYYSTYQLRILIWLYHLNLRRLHCIWYRDCANVVWLPYSYCLCRDNRGDASRGRLRYHLWELGLLETLLRRLSLQNQMLTIQ